MGNIFLSVHIFWTYSSDVITFKITNKHKIKPYDPQIKPYDPIIPLTGIL